VLVVVIVLGLLAVRKIEHDNDDDKDAGIFLIVLVVVVVLGLPAVKKTSTKDDDEND
jgi:heme A synthase